MNPRRMVVEDRVLAVAERLALDGQVVLAARLRETVPDGFGNCDEHVGILRIALSDVARLADYTEDCTRVLDALDDLPRFIGRRGRVWVSHDSPGGYAAYWDEDDWLEDGPHEALLDEVLAWAARRSDDVRMPAD